jgi:hypothetical protein
MPQCQLYLGPYKYNILPSTGAAQEGLGRLVRGAQREEQSRIVLAVAGSDLTPHCHWRMRRSSAKSTSNLIPSHPTPPRPRPHPRPYPRPQDLPERISKAAVNLNYQCQLQLLDFSSRYNSPPVASILSPGERHRRLTAHIFLSFVPRSGAGYRSGTQGRSGQARHGRAALASPGLSS